MLELLKLGQMHIHQDETYGTIELIHGKAKEFIEDDVPQENGPGKGKKGKGS